MAALRRWLRSRDDERRSVMSQFLSARWLQELEELHRERSVVSMEFRTTNRLRQLMDEREALLPANALSAGPSQEARDFFDLVRSKVDVAERNEVGSVAVVEITGTPTGAPVVIAIEFGSLSPHFSTDSSPTFPVARVRLSYKAALAAYKSAVNPSATVDLSSVTVLYGSVEYLNLIIAAFLGDGPAFAAAVAGFTDDEPRIEFGSLY